MTSFVFLTATDDGGLSPRATKQMRAHITRTNFAKRRERLAKSAATETLSPSGAQITEDKRGSNVLGQERRAVLLRPLISRTYPLPIHLLTVAQAGDSLCSAQTLSRTWSHVFMEGQTYPRSPDEAAWLELLASEPALFESSMAIGMRHWSPDVTCQLEAQIHWSRAANAIIERISSGCADSVAVLVAVATMAFGERLAGNIVTWGVHVDGLTHLLKQRLAQGHMTLSIWIYRIMILDAFNDALHFPRFYHEKIVKEISRLGHHPLLDIAALCSDLNRIRVSLQGSSMPLPENLAECDDLLCRSQMLQTQEDPFIRATSCAVELVLRLSLRRYRPQENLTCMAGKLRDALESLSLRPCSYMDMTSLHLMIGALASDEGSTERAWFISKLRRAVLGLEARWENPLEILEEVFVPDDDLAGPLKALWHELRTSSHSVDQDRRRLLLSP